MARQFSLPYQIPPDTLLPNAADAAGRSSTNWVSMRGVLKAWVIFTVNQGNAATVLLSVLQATTLAGAGSKAIAAVPIWANQDTAAADGNTAQTAAATFTTSAALKDKRVIFEITPDVALDVANSFDHVGVSTGASNAANITGCMILRYHGIQMGATPTDRV